MEGNPDTSPSKRNNFETHIGRFAIRVREVEDLSYYTAAAVKVTNGIMRIRDGLIYATFGASKHACVDGFAIDQGQNDPYIFHINPSQFQEPIDEIDSGIGGLIGGNVKEYVRDHHNIRTGAFIELPGSVISILVKRDQDSMLDIFYMSDV